LTITIKHYNETITFETEADDLSMEDLVEIFRRAALAMGYQPDNVNEYLPEIEMRDKQIDDELIGLLDWLDFNYGGETNKERVNAYLASTERL
jgi:hypothetical protein